METPSSAHAGNLEYQAAVLESKKQKYRRNYLTFLLDSFFFSFSVVIFSYTTVLPVYVSGLTENTIFISLLAVLYFGLSNGASIFSGILGANAKSPKWATVYICLTQRLGLLLMFLSTYAATGNRSFALVLFFFSYGIFGAASGMASPVHSVLVSSTIYRNVSSFYGTNNLVGAFAGVLAAQIIRFFMARYGFPFNYRWLFLFGLFMAFFSTIAVAAGISETREEKKKRFTFSMLPGTIRDIFKKNRGYRNFLVIRIFTAAAEMSIPFYIIHVASKGDSGERIIGSMTTVLLVSNMAASKIIGYIGNRSGPMAMIRLTAITGVLAGLLAIIIPSTAWGYVVFVLAGFAISGNIISNYVANIHFAEEGHVSFYTMTSGIIIAPFYIVFSFLGGIIADRLSISSVFICSASLYALSLILNLALNRRKKA